MKQSMGYSADTARQNVMNELSLYAQAIWYLTSRAVARHFGFAKKGRNKGQARYKQYTEQATSVSGKASAAMPETLPAGTLTEIRSISYLGAPCGAEAQSQNLQQGLKQMLPALAGFCQQRWLVLVAPPCLPSVKELRQAGIEPTQVLVVHSRAADDLIVLEQTLRSGTCGAVVAWLEKGDAQTLGRLRQAAEAGNAWGVLFRAAQQKPQSRALIRSLNEGAQLKIAMS